MHNTKQLSKLLFSKKGLSQMIFFCKYSDELKTVEISKFGTIFKTIGTT